MFLYSVFRARKAKLQRLQRRYQLGDSGDHEPIRRCIFCARRRSALSDADRSRLMRKLMEVEIKALEDLTAGNEASFDGIVDRQSAVEAPLQCRDGTSKPGQLMSRPRREVSRGHRS